MRDAYFVSENKMINELFRELQKNKNQLAIVLDEYGGTAGIVSMEDMRAIFVDMYAFDILRIYIASNMISFINHKHGFPRCFSFLGDDSSIKTSTNY